MLSVKNISRTIKLFPILVENIPGGFPGNCSNLTLPDIPGKMAKRVEMKNGIGLNFYYFSLCTVSTILKS
jgi:hypothetical protein